MINNLQIGKIYTRTYEQDDGQGFYDLIKQYVMITRKARNPEDRRKYIYFLYDIQDHDSIWWEYEDILKEELNEL